MSRSPKRPKLSTSPAQLIKPVNYPKIQELSPRQISPLGTIEPQVVLDGPLDFDKTSRRWLFTPVNSSTDSNSESTPKEIGVGVNGGVGEEEDNTLPPLTSISSLNISPPANREICFGMIYNARVKILEPSSLSAKTFGSAITTTGICPVTMVKTVAVLNEETTNALKNLSNLPKLRFNTYITMEGWDDLISGESKSNRMFHLPIDIVLYGAPEVRQAVGTQLSSARIYLQHPCYQEAGTEYDNPHFLKLDSILENYQVLGQINIGLPLANSNDTNITNYAEHMEEATQQAQVRRKVANVLDSLTRAKHLKRLEADVRINTKLLPHQEEALDFMAQREFGPIPSEYSLWSTGSDERQVCYEHRIVGSKTSSIPVEIGGGILADDMGLGKTLTVISTIIRTVNEAKMFVEEETTNHSNKMEQGKSSIYLPARSTFVICPSPLLLEGWIEEIRTHCNNSLNIVVYHGRGRESNRSVLADSDIVLSTYHTIAAEFLDPECPLYKMKFFRIVLDEAHIIRRMSTKLFRAVAQLSAKLRWCLTGTPVQNSLEDLAALVAFIRASPLDNLLDFRKYVIVPLLRNTGMSSEALRCLLDSICLRRTKKLLYLPEDKCEFRSLDFSPSERIQYNSTESEMVNAVKQHDNQGPNTKGYFGIFQLQLQLRRLCNHGTFQKPFSQLPSEEIQFDAEQALSLLREKNEAKCKYCKIEVTGLNMEDECTGHFTTFGHLLCSECVPSYETSLRKTQGNSRLQCSLCLAKVTPGYFLMEKAIAKSSTNKDTTTTEYFQTHGFSSKVSRLVHDIQENTSAKKSIVFSCWTRSLDLVEKHLAKCEIPFARIDGSYTLVQRQKMLKDFNHDPSLRILIMTTGTGATGLNLTIANIVYILEPQWNPMIEDQAVARVLRLGQTSEVKVVRYIMKDTVEDSMRSQQTRKLEFAKVGWRADE